jgi:hypothetical protein
MVSGDGHDASPSISDLSENLIEDVNSLTRRGGSVIEISGDQNQIDGLGSDQITKP